MHAKPYKYNYGGAFSLFVGPCPSPLGIWGEGSGLSQIWIIGVMRIKSWLQYSKKKFRGLKFGEIVETLFPTHIWLPFLIEQAHPYVTMD